jgi:hypothetical protein
MDVINLTENLLPEQLGELETERMKVSEKQRQTYHKFIKEFIKVYSKEEAPYLRLLKAVFINNLSDVKKLVGQKEFSIPRVAVKTITGLDDV